jgi:fluoroacetyl-CoA thioesterase
MDLHSGLTASVALTVTEADTAQAVGSGDVPVLGTPRVLALAEAATVALTRGRLPDGTTTVGTRIELEHLVPSRVGARVVAEAELSTVEGRRLEFTVQVRDGATLAATGRVHRLIVDRERFLSRLVAP